MAGGKLILGKLLTKRPSGLFLVLVSVALLALVALVLVLFTQLERRFIFFPSREVLFSPDQLGVTYEDVYFTTEDGLQLNGWYLPGSSDMTWLWFHGNGGNISDRVGELALIHHRMGVNLFIFDYRGYGRSQGKPSEQGTYRDTRAALKYLQGRADVDPGQIVYFGRSLGAAVAVELATVQPPLALVLVSPFASIRDMARQVVPLLPIHVLVPRMYDSISRIRQIQRPLLVLHGDQDTEVPPSQGRKLFEAANQPKRFQNIQGAGHNDTLAVGGQALWDALVSFLDSLSDSGDDGSYTN